MDTHDKSNSSETNGNENGKYNGDDLVEEFCDADIEDEGEDEDEDVIDEDQYDNADIVFSLHEGSVFVVDVNANGKYAVSGGEDDKAYVWDVESGNVMFESKGNDSVTCACFSADSSLVAIGDMSGLIKAYEVETKQEIWQFQTGDLEWLLWHPAASVLMAGTQDGDAWLWKIPSGESKTFPSPGCTCTCGKILPDGKHAALGYSDGSTRIFDLKTQQAVHSISKGRELHRGGVSHIDCSGDGQVTVTGSLDGSVKLINNMTGKVSVTYRDFTKHDTDEHVDRTIEYVGFSNSLSLVATASLNGLLSIWDVKSGLIRHKCKHPEGVTRLVWDDKGMTLYSGCLDGICRQWNARSGELINTFIGHSDQIYDLALSRDGRRLLSACADGTVRVYDTDEAFMSTS